MPIPVECKIVVQMKGEVADATLRPDLDPNTGLGAFGVLEVPRLFGQCLSAAIETSVEAATLEACRSRVKALARDHFPRIYDVRNEPQNDWHRFYEGQWIPGGDNGFAFGFQVTELDSSTGSYVPMQRTLRIRRTDSNGNEVTENILARYFFAIQNQSQ